jgi:DeoR/GlpR family transcriptional regulator of sugar metabolism
MGPKEERLVKIKSFLRFQTSPCSISEIHEALTIRYHFRISRKTIQRDLQELCDKRQVIAFDGIPIRFSLAKPEELELVLKINEVNQILQCLDPQSELFIKIKSKSSIF